MFYRLFFCNPFQHPGSLCSEQDSPGLAASRHSTQLFGKWRNKASGLCEDTGSADTDQKGSILSLECFKQTPVHTAISVGKGNV